MLVSTLETRVIGNRDRAICTEYAVVLNDQDARRALLDCIQNPVIDPIDIDRENADVTPELMHGMVAGGADVIELGVPFSDPSADGPVIQKAGDKALAFGIGLVQVLAMVREFRKTNSTTPVVAPNSKLLGCNRLRLSSTCGNPLRSMKSRSDE